MARPGISCDSMNQGRRTQQERRADSEHRLLTATAELIIERGFGQLSLVSIGERAGCSHALVTHLFGTKAAMLERLNAMVEELYRQRIEPVVADTAGLESVAVFARTYLDLATSEDPIARVHGVLWAQAVAGSVELRPSNVEWDRNIRSRVAKLVAQAAGKPDVDSSCETTAFVIVGLLRSVATQYLLDPQSVDLPAVVERVTAAATALVTA
ncbi:TetR/AcrR family transcriptional regulator [Mycobacterium sp. NPDC050441]|uniref:TetR/AcrR family transcriptional regulator n=1 Tax=Mycobacterium sp. NPDC050441 TaxID=3155403 RepID=UPI0033FF7BA2